MRTSERGTSATAKIMLSLEVAQRIRLRRDEEADEEFIDARVSIVRESCVHALKRQDTR